MKLAQSLFVLLLAVRVAPAADAALTDFFPPGTRVVFGAHVRTIVESPLTQAAVAQVRAQAQAQIPDAAKNWLAVTKLAGFDPLHDIDEVLVASTGKGQNPPTVVVASGRFDVARLARDAKPYHDVPILGGDKPSDGVVALLDGSTALAGDRSSVLAAIDHRGGAGEDTGLAERIASLRDRYDIWGIGDHLEGIIPASAQSQGLDSIDRFQFGIAIQQDVELAGEIHATSPKDAEKLSATLGLLSAMMKAQQPSSGTKFDLQEDHGTFKVVLKVPEEQVKKAIEAQRAAFERGLASATQFGSQPLSVVNAAPAAASLSPLQAAPPATPKAAPPAVVDKDGNTVILTLPGKK